MKIVKLNESFIFELLNLCKSVGWLHDEIFMKKQFEMYLSIGTLVGYIHENKLIATGGVFPFTSNFTSIGMLIVHPNFQGRGIGRMLLNHCLEQFIQNNPLHLLRQKLANLYTHHADFKQQQRFIVLKSKLLRRPLLTYNKYKKKTLYLLLLSINCNWYESFSTLLFAITKGRTLF
ncbi:acetyltransferase [Bacillus cereus]|nr:acetyltransferase [Bacillus cereus]